MNFEKANSINFDEKYLVKTPYPEIEVTNLPQDILMKIKRAYAGYKSELTSTVQYSYQHFILGTVPALNNVSKALEDIGIKEMIHYEMLAKILVRCGIDPKNCVYIDGNPNICDFWKASNVNYEKDIIKFMENNILIEKRAIEEYMKIVEETTSENLKAIILRIIEDEKSHIMYFKAVLEALKN